MELINRKREQDLLKDIFSSSKSEFIAIYGRRRIGKTFLVTKFFAVKNCIFFYVTGRKDSNMKQQLEHFSKKVESTFYQEGIYLKPARTWMEALSMLTSAIDIFAKRKKVVVFLDELPWLATPKSELMQSLDHFWNTTWINNPKFKLIVCGSAASWMINKLIKNKGGLHNRLTETIRMMPFDLYETKMYLQNKGIRLKSQQIIELYLITGGVAHYLDHIKKGLSSTQNIDRLAFTNDGLLFKEYDKLFSSLFDNSESHLEITKLIAQKRYGMSKDSLTKTTKLSSSGGSFNKKLEELEEAGFILSIMPYGHKKKGVYYLIYDEYLYFYYNWIAPIKNTLRKIDDSSGYWQERSLTPAWSSWKGYAFEILIYKNLSKVRKLLQISPGAEVGAWRHAPKAKSGDDGVQIDLLFDRLDDAITICEIKYTDKPFVINKEYSKNIQRKVNVFKKVTKTEKHIFIALISASGLKENMYSEQLISQVITIDDLLTD